MTEKLLFLGGPLDGMRMSFPKSAAVVATDKNGFSIGYAKTVDIIEKNIDELFLYFRGKLELGSDKRGWKTIIYMRPKGELIFPEDLIEHLMKGYGENDG